MCLICLEFLVNLNLSRYYINHFLLHVPCMHGPIYFPIRAAKFYDYYSFCVTLICIICILAVKISTYYIFVKIIIVNVKILKNYIYVHLCVHNSTLNFICKSHCI